MLVASPPHHCDQSLTPALSIILGETEVQSWETSETPSKPSQSLQEDRGASVGEVEGEGALEEVEERGGERTAGRGTASKLRRLETIESD